MPPSSCPEIQVLEQFMVGKVPAAEAQRLEQHLQDCPPCLETLNGLKVDDSLAAAMAAAPQAAVSPKSEVVEALIERVCGNATESLPNPDALTTALPMDLQALLAPPEGPDEIGRLGKYRLRKQLGEGGMGVVFAAEDTVLRREVALKVMRPHYAVKPDARSRFLREARAMAALQHDHIVTVYEVGEDRNLPFLAMQFLKGMSLADWFKKKPPLSMPQVLKLGREMALALAAAHKKGLIHRDIKPANVWLEAPKGRIKILDFGLARLDREAGLLTQEGDLLGTPAFMAPEQARGETVDGRADLFSLGCVLYQACTGKLPFVGPGFVEVMFAVMQLEPIPVREANPDVPPALADLVTRLLAKEAVHRPASAEEVADALRAIERGNVTTLAAKQVATAVHAPSRRRFLLTRLLPAALGVFVLGIIIYFSMAQGQLVIETDDPDLSFQVNKDKTQVTLKDAKTNRTYLLRVAKGDLQSGESELEVTDPDAGMHFTTKTLTIKSGEKVRLRAWYRREGIPPPPPGDTPPYTGTPSVAGKVFTNSIGMKLTVIPAGKFWMGTRQEELGKQRWLRHAVEITRPFAMGVHEVTVGQFRRFVKETGYRTTAETKGGAERLYGTGFQLDLQADWQKPGYEQTENYPVVCVSWPDAVAFCNWLSKTEGRIYRLPTEAEWEYACRAGSTAAFCFGDDPKELPKYAWFVPPSELRAHPVGERKPNAWGLYDMHGNAWEWCADWYDREYYERSPSQDPTGPAEPPASLSASRVLRGGSWFGYAPNCTSFDRNCDAPEARKSSVGFRVVCQIPAIESSTK
jgi:formylglycine-generating enzyme required for sulfatase activity/predicted Ser/Thr protein kinase